MGPGLIPRPLAIGIAVVITGVWAASQLGTLFVPGYQAPDAIHAALMIVLGAVFALRRTDAEAEQANDEQEEAPEPPARTRPPRDPRGPGRPESAADMIARLQRERDNP